MITPLLIINLTPDSFSDGGKYLSSEIISSTIEKAMELGINMFDLGAESTAPMNNPIDYKQEIERLTPFIDLFLKNEIKLSIDTYHPETIEWLLSEKKISDFIWNDVSGVLNDHTLELLKRNKSLEYVLCHNNLDKKNETSFHMDHLIEGDIKEHLLSRWQKQVILLQQKQISLERVWFDPCFGFAKTFQQNEELFHFLPEIEKQLPISKWLIGISKKSFLRKRAEIEGSVDLYNDSEIIHFELVRYWNQVLAKPFLWRIHNPFLARAMNYTLSEFNS